LAFLAEVDRHRVLEVGNVLSQYTRVSHEVVDKYERAPGVINEDVVAFVPDKLYDLIISVSTLEHVGWDETPREPDKIIRAFQRLRSMLTPGGECVATLPLGYNPNLDKLLDCGELGIDERYCYKRVSLTNRWEQVAWEHARGARYGAPYPFANAVVIAVTRASQPGRTETG
jgi:SAM-dependent methyltransferase